MDGASLMTQGSDRTPSFGPKLKSAWDWAISNADVTAAFVLGVGFGVLGLTKVIKGDALPEATLAVLSVLALALVHERRIREGIDKRLDDLGTAIHGLDQTVASLQAGGQYHVLEHQATWDIASDDGRLAYA